MDFINIELPRLRQAILTGERIDWRSYRIAMAVTAIWAAAILVLHIVFVMFKGNPSNNIVSHVKDYADSLAGPLKDLFTFKNPKTNTLINYGIAAIVWVAVGRLIASLLQRIKT